MALEAFARGIATAFAIISALSGCTAASGERIREQVHQSIAADASSAVEIDNIAGSVQVEGWPRPLVDVQATKYGYDAEELRGVAIEVRREGAGISIATRYASGVHGGGVRYVVSVPEGASLRVSNDAGTVDVDNVSGNLVVETQAGKITADAGRVGANRSISLRATTGAISLTIAPGSDATVDAASTVGNFSSDIPGVTKTRENIVGARGGGTIGNGSGRIHLETTTGAIALRQR
ncbi:MAG TPA: DUF4097 family beta strand repeat-containing protein [Candidatus Cybelea sp.]|jgi:hypothetical protein|nr:DUF4097 family beta strand repeat-containing protein [Candidatus Cybelea sp.]